MGFSLILLCRKFLFVNGVGVGQHFGNLVHYLLNFMFFE